MSPRSATQFEEMREQSRTAILEAALKLFAQKGFHGTSIAQIAKEAGVSKGLMYNYFEKKEDLLTGLIQKEMQGGEAIMAEMMTLKDPKEQLRFIIRRAFHEIRENSEHNKLLMMLSLHLNEFPFVKEVIAGKYHGSMPLFTGLLQGAGIPDHEAETRFLAAFFDGVALQYHVLGYDLPLDQMEKDLLKRYQLT